MKEAMAFATLALLAGCAMTSGVMDAGNGNYLISAHAAPVRGGATGADRIAYQTANDFCAQKGGLHAVVANASERDVYQGGSAGSFAYNQSGGSGGFGGGVFASGNANLMFRCEP